MSNICLACVGDQALRTRLEEEATDLTCSYCNKQGPGVSLEQLAESVDGPLREFCEIGDSHPVFFGESDKPDFEQEGESLENLLEAELEIEYGAAEELAKLLVDLDPAWPPDGGEPFFESDQRYHRRHLSSGEYGQGWEAFSNRIKHERRFFDDEGRQWLAQILGERGSERAGELPVLEVGPSTRVEILFRARRADTEAEALRTIKNPAANLGPPAPHLAVAGRMNPAGIPVFYGALSEDTALAEVRPSVGSLVVVSGFRPSKRLRLLDLSQIGIGFTGSIFAPGYEDRAARRRFLEGFHTLIARPIQPHQEALEYIPTQAVAEYVSHVLELDGILYASAQVGAVPDPPEPSLYVRMHELTDEELAQQNVALFGLASRIIGATSPDAPECTSPERQADAAGILKIVPESVRARLVSSVSYAHKWEYIYDPDRLDEF